MTRVLTAFDALRQVAVWFAGGAIGAGPLTVPMPATAGTANTGGGGGGGCGLNATGVSGAAGGSGIVIVRYRYD